MLFFFLSYSFTFAPLFSQQIIFLSFNTDSILYYSTQCACPGLVRIIFVAFYYFNACFFFFFSAFFFPFRVSQYFHFLKQICREARTSSPLRMLPYRQRRTSDVITLKGRKLPRTKWSPDNPFCSDPSKSAGDEWTHLFWKWIFTELWIWQILQVQKKEILMWSFVALRKYYRLISTGKGLITLKLDS